MFSAFATQGIESKEKGKFTREELAPLAKINVESLKEFDYFTYATADGNKARAGRSAAGLLARLTTDQVLTLNFTLPFKTPVKAKELKIEIYDPTIFVDFAFAKKDPVQLVGAPASCKLDVVLPREMTFAEGKALSADPRRPAEYDRWPGARSSPTRFWCIALERMVGGASGSIRLAMSCGADLARVRCLYSGSHRLPLTPRWRSLRHDARRAAAEAGGFTGWILAKQAEFYRMLSGLIRAAKADGSAAYDAARHLVSLRHLPRRRPRPRQGGDLVLSGRQ